jgi:hypothetical protein
LIQILVALAPKDPEPHPWRTCGYLPSKAQDCLFYSSPSGALRTLARRGECCVEL